MRTIGVWTLTAFALIDLGIGLLFRPPADPRDNPSALQRYFNYGKSVEGKLRDFLGPIPERDAPIMKAGWLPTECDMPTVTPSGKLGVDIYGMSFANQIADFMEAFDPGVAAQRFAGPGAPPNHGYACFLRRVEGRQPRAPVQILAILASSLPRMMTLSGLTTSFEGPQPFTYPRYTLGSDGRLMARTPPITSQADLRAALADPPRWQAFLDDLTDADAFYAPSILRADLLDYSAAGRLLRRAWGQHLIRQRMTAAGADNDFASTPGFAELLGAMMVDFAERSRAAGQRPLVLLIEDRGHGRALSAMALPVLRAHAIDYVASSSLVAPDDSGNFVADGHFVPAASQRIARAVLGVLGRHD